MKNLIIVILAVTLATTAQAQKISTDKVPAAVTKSFKEKFPNVEGAKWEMEKTGEYEATFKMNKEEASANFDKDGKWMETEMEIEVSNLPAAVQQTVAKQFADYKIKEAEQTETPEKGKFYEVEIQKEKVRMEVSFAADGEVMGKKDLNDKKDEKD